MVRLTWIACLCALGVLAGGTLGEEEKVHHGGHHDRHDPLSGEKEIDGERNKHRDHEAIIGSRKEAEEADEMSPEESKKFLEKLALNHDKNRDGFIDKAEFKAWILESFKRLNEEEALDRLKEEDMNGDGKITWKEYLLQSFDFSLSQVEEMRSKPEEHDNKLMVEMVEEDNLKFVSADVDKDGFLDRAEYVAFYHPYDHEHMHDFEMERGLREHDKDNDSSVTLQEFLQDEEDEEEWLTKETQFKDLDADGDGRLEGAELRKWLLTDPEDYVDEEEAALRKIADDDKDDKLSLEEILAHREDFISSSATDYGVTLERMKDELRLDEEEALERMKEEDTDNNGLTWKEYLMSQYDYSLKQLEEMKQKPDEEDNKNMLEMVEEDEQRFVAADLNKDGILDKTEYVAFYHPYDYEHMHKFEIERGIKDYDKNGDGVVTVEEFIGDEEDEETRNSEKEEFEKNDVDGNGKLEGAELKKWLVQDNEDSANEEVNQLMETADDNKDKKLSIKEILDHQEDLVNSQATDYGATLEKMRDEL